jgi:hypothetical protein
MENPAKSEAVNTLLEQALEAHGGMERWEKVNKVTLSMTVGGLVFFIKGRRRYVGKPFSADIYTREQKTVIMPFGNQPGISGIFMPDRVWLENEKGDVVKELKNPACYRAFVKSLFPWDHFGQLYFGGYAINHYFNLPFSLVREGVQLEGISPVTIDGELCQGLRVIYPDNFVSHSRKEKLYFNQKGQIVRHDYKAGVVGPFAYGCHYSMDYFGIDEFIFAGKRRVYFNFSGIPLRPMAILYMNIHEGKVHYI